jgi:hypothetical protein
MTYVDVFHPVLFLDWLDAHEQLWPPHVRTKVGNKRQLAVFANKTTQPTEIYKWRT